MERFDWLIRGGRILDPAAGLDFVGDLGIRAGRIDRISEGLDPSTAAQVFEASGLLVVPGLVDLHIHGYHLATPLGVEVDHYCLGRGVTTAVDAGSAGSSTFAGFRAFAVERCRTRLLAFLHVSCAGLAFAGLGGDSQVPGELESLKLVRIDDFVRCVEENRDVIVGVKIRLSDTIADGGRNEEEAYRMALEGAARVSLPLMVHHNFSTVSREGCPGKLGPGDIYTHAFHGFPGCLVDPESRRMHSVTLRARERGVLFDVGHGQGSFNWTVAEIAAAEGFFPDTISTDLHDGTREGPAYDLPTVMSRMLHLGMPLPEVVAAATWNPARAVRLQDWIGSLKVGREADVTVLKEEEVDVDLEDCQAQLRRIRRRLVPVAVWRRGEPAAVTSPAAWPNRKVLPIQRPWWDRLIVRDAIPPQAPADSAADTPEPKLETD